MLIVAGASALDPLDPVFGGLALLGATMERHGAPAHPGSLLWLARWDGAARARHADLRDVLAGDDVRPRAPAHPRPARPIGNREIAGLGHGGLLSREMAYRFPPYRANVARGELE